ncbi:MAG: hypothetical protein ACERKZ_11260 [Lachnotalea sp.]
MEEIKVTLKKEKENIYQFDVRMGAIRTRPTIECDEQVAQQIQKQITLINERPELFNVEENLIYKELVAAIYEKYEVKADNDFFDYAISETAKILKLLGKKSIILRKSPVNELIATFDNQKDSFIRMLFLGQFGTGKSTIIKKISAIQDEVDFPVVDTARTTIHDAHYIFKDIQKGNFKLSIDFKDTKEIFSLVSECYIRAIDRIFAGLVENKNIDEIQDKAMIEFVTDPDKIFKIEYVLGKYYERDNKKRELSEKAKQVKYWDSIYNSITQLIIEFLDKVNGSFDNGLDKNLVIESNIRDQFIKDCYYGDKIDEMIWAIVELLENKIREICINMESEGKGTIVYQNEEIVGFRNGNFDVSKIEEYVTPFSSTSIKNFTKIVTPLVQSMAIEVPYNEKISDENKKHTICITDTVGFEHRKTDDTGSLEGSTKYSYNNYDIIGIIDSAKQSMNGTTENLLREIYNNADKSKVMLMYTFYDEFTKKDFEDEHDKQYFLKDLQSTTLRKIDETENVEKFIATLDKKTYFLQGLVSSDGKKNCIDEMLWAVGDHFENLYNYKKVEIIDKRKSIMGFNYRRLALVFNKAQEDYIKQQKNLYLQNYPGYKTTEALTRKLKNGGTYFVGTSRAFKPVDDFCNILMEKIDRFIKNPDEINFEIKTTIPNHKDKVIDWFKEEISSNIKVLVKKMFVDVRMDTWKKLYMDGGPGVDARRRNGIVKELNNILPELIIDESNFADRWIEEIEDIFENVLLKMKESN